MTGDVSPETVPVAQVQPPPDPVGQVYSYEDVPSQAMTWEQLNSVADMPASMDIYGHHDDVSASLKASYRTPWDDESEDIQRTVETCLNGGSVSDAQACVADRFGLQPGDVARNWSEFEKYDTAARQADAFSSRDFRRQYPYQAKLILEKPEMADVVVNNAGFIDVLTNGTRYSIGVLRMVADKGLSATLGNMFGSDRFKAKDVEAFLEDHQDFFLSREALSGTSTRSVPKQALTDDGFLGNAYRAFQAGRVDSMLSDLGKQMEQAILSGDEDEQLRLQYERQRLLGERESVMPAGNGYVQGLVDEAVASAPGTLEVLGATAAGTAVGAAVGALAGPAGLASGALAGAKAGASIGGVGATFAASRSQQLGGNLWDFIDARTDDGRRLDPVQAVAAARKSATMGAAVESADAALTMATLGGAKLLSKAGAGAVGEAIRKSAVSQAASSPLMKILEGSASEAAEEVAQSAIQTYYEQSLKEAADGHLQRFDWKAFGNEMARTALVSGLAGGAFSGVAVGSRAAMDRFADHIAAMGRLHERSVQETNAVSDAAMVAETAKRMAQTPEDAREKVAQTLVKDAVKADGTPVGLVQVEPSDIVSWFSSRGRDWRQEVSSTMGEGAAVRIQKAVDEGGVFDMSMVSFASDFSAFRDESTGRTLAQDIAGDVSLDGGLTASDVEALHADDDSVMETLRDAANGTLGEDMSRVDALKASIARMSGDISKASQAVEAVISKAPEVQARLTEAAVASGMDRDTASRGVAAIMRMATETAARTGDTYMIDVLGDDVTIGRMESSQEARDTVARAASEAPQDIDQWTRAVDSNTSEPQDANEKAASGLAEGESRLPKTEKGTPVPGASEGTAPSVEPEQPSYESMAAAMAGEEYLQDSDGVSYVMPEEEASRIREEHAARLLEAARDRDDAGRIKAAETLKAVSNSEESAENLVAAQQVQDIAYSRRQEPGSTPLLDALLEGKEVSEEPGPSEKKTIDGGKDWDEDYEGSVSYSLGTISEDGRLDVDVPLPKTVSMLVMAGVVDRSGVPTRFGHAVSRLSASGMDRVAMRLVWNRLADNSSLAKKISEAAYGIGSVDSWTASEKNDAKALMKAFGRYSGYSAEMSGKSLVGVSSSIVDDSEGAVALYESARKAASEGGESSGDEVEVALTEYGLDPDSGISDRSLFRGAAASNGGLWNYSSTHGMDTIAFKGSMDDALEMLLAMSGMEPEAVPQVETPKGETAAEVMADSMTEAPVEEAPVEAAPLKGNDPMPTPLLDSLMEGRETAPEDEGTDAMYLEGDSEWDEDYAGAIAIALEDIDANGSLDIEETPSKAVSMLRYGGVVSADGTPTRFGLAVSRLSTSSATEGAAYRMVWDRLAENLPLAQELKDVSQGKAMKGWSEAMRHDAAALVNAFGEHAGISTEMDEDGEPSSFSYEGPVETLSMAIDYGVHRSSDGEGSSLAEGRLESLLRIQSGEPAGSGGIEETLLRGMFGSHADESDRTTLYQTKGGRRVAKTMFTRDESKGFAQVLLGEDADETSVVHELAHVLLRAMRRTAMRKDATPEMKMQWNAAASWLGIAGDAEPTAEQEEQFASQMELLANEGETEMPGAEGAMSFGFEWTQAMRRNAHAMGIELNPGIEGFLESMSFGDGALMQASVQAVTEMLPAAMAANGDGASMDAFMKRALEGAKQVSTAERLKAAREAYPERLKVLKESVQADYSRMVSDLEGEISSSLGYRYRQALATGYLDGVRFGPAKLSKAEFLKASGLKRTPKSMKGLVEDGGVPYADFAKSHPELSETDAATFFRAVMEAPNDARAEALRRATREYASTPSGKAFQELADALEATKRPAFSAAVANQMFEDLYRLRKSSTARGEIEAACAQRLMEQRLDGPEGKASHWFRAVRRESYKVMSALKPSRTGRAGADREVAAVHQTNAAAAYQMGFLVSAEVRRARRDAAAMKRMARREGRAAVGFASDAALDVMDSFLADMGFRKPSADARDVSGRASLESLAEEMDRAGTPMPFDVAEVRRVMDEAAGRTGGDGSGKHGYGHLRVRDQRLASDFAGWLRGMSSRRDVRIDGKDMTLEAAVSEAVASLPDTKARRYVNKGDRTVLEKAREALQDASRDRREALSILEEMGPFGLKVMDTFMAAEVDRTDRARDIDADMARIMDPSRPAMKTLNGKVETPDFARGAYSDGFRRKNLVAMLLNMGNTGNLERLVHGYGMEFQEGLERVTDYVSRNVTRDEVAMAQEILDLMESRLYPAVSRTFRDVNGFPMSRVQATPMKLVVEGEETELRGGYYPVFYDSQFARTGAVQELSTEDTVKAWDRSVRDGFTKSRAAGVPGFGPLSLDLSRMPQAVADQLKYATHERAARDVGAVVSSKEFQAAARERLGRSYVQTLGDILGTFAHGPAMDHRFRSGVMDFISRRLPVYMLGFRAGPFVADLARPGTAVGMGYADAAATAAAMARPRSTVDWVTRASGAYRVQTAGFKGRFESSERMRGAMQSRISGGWDRFQELVNRYAFAGMELSNRYNLAAIWAGAYAKAGGTLYEDDIRPEAAAAADRALERFAINAVDWAKAPVQNSERYRLLTVFAGEAIKMYSVLGYARPGEISRALREGDLGALARRLAALTSIVVWYPLAGAFLMGKGPRKDEDAAWWAARNVLGGVAGWDPLIASSAYRMAEAVASGKPAEAADIPAWSAVATSVRHARQAWKADGLDERALETLLAAGLAAGLPGRELEQLLAPLSGKAGQDPIDDPLDLIEAMAYGRRKGRGSSPLNPSP